MRGPFLLHRAPFGVRPYGNDRRPCTCGHPWIDSYVHRTDGARFHVASVEW